VLGKHRTGCRTLIIGLRMVHFTVATWQQVAQSAVVKRLRKCSFGHELNVEVDSGSDSDMKKRTLDFNCWFANGKFHNSN